MRKLLPIIFSVIIGVFAVFSFVSDVSAQQIGTSPTPANPEGQWVKDEEVTFTGKTAARSNNFLQWALDNYEWINLTLGDGSEADSNPLAEFWGEILRIVLVMIVLFVLVAAFIIIITRGQNVTIMRFIPRFIIILLLIIFSFAIVRFLYQFFDVIQGFFLTVNDPSGGGDKIIGPEDLLYIAFNYESFIGFRQVGMEFDESAYISLLLVKITAVTYYVMTGILIIRKIILWFFLIISPVFPLLLFFRPLRNTAKIWIGEFFRWLLYAPLFAIFLHGLVGMWRDRIPLGFDFSGVGDPTQIVYPTAINILLGGPGQQIGLNNSVNLGHTFALYVVALLMLWVVILLPWLLLQIFLDYLNNFSFTDSNLYQRIASTNIPFINKPIGGGGGNGPDSPQPSQPQGPASKGMAKSLPFTRKRQMQIPVKKVTSADRSSQIASRQSRPVSTTVSAPASTSTTNITNETNEVLKRANLSVPKMRDIARMESASLTNNQNIQQQKTDVTNKLNQISNPASAPSVEREKYTTIKEKLVQQQQKGDPVAGSIINASRLGSRVSSRAKETGETVKNSLRMTLQHIANPTTALDPEERKKVEDIKKEVLSAQQQGNPLATYILDMSEKVTGENINEQEGESLLDKIKDKLFAEKEKGNELAEKVLPKEETVTTQAPLPSVNRVQQVSLDEYEEVKNIWKDNYTNMEPPAPLEGKQLSKEEWINNDVQKINETVNLLSSTDQTQVQKGMEMVSDILPFLLIGGFSKSEVIAYLKAKQAAGKEVLGQQQQAQEEEDTLLENKPKQNENEKTMTMRRELPSDDEKENSGQTGQNTPETQNRTNNQNIPEGQNDPNANNNNNR